MYNLTEQEQAATLNGQNTAKETDKLNSGQNEHLIKRDNYLGLQIIEMEDERSGSEKRHFAVLGRSRITEYFETKEELIKWIDENPYHIMAIIAAVVIEKLGK